MKTLSDKEFGNDERYGELLMDKTAFWREDIVEFIINLKLSLREIVWDIATEEGGSNLHYNDLINDKIDKLIGSGFDY